MAGIIEVKDQGKLRIYDADNSHYVDIVVPSSVTANRTITIPDASFTVPQVTNATHSGEVTGATALTIADNIVDEANLKVSNSAVNGYMLTAQSGNTGGLTWAAAPAGITVADQWRINTNISASAAAYTDITANWERVDTAGQGFIGTAMSQSSGIFTFPSTGVYLVHAQLQFFDSSAALVALGVQIAATVNNSSYTRIADNYTSNASGGNTNFTSSTQSLVDVTSTTNVKVKFQYYVSGSITIYAPSTVNSSYVTFTRLGDT